MFHFRKGNWVKMLTVQWQLKKFNESWSLSGIIDPKQIQKE